MITAAIADTSPLFGDKERLPSYEEQEENWSGREEMMSEMSDVIKKPLSTAKRQAMRAGIRREAEQLEKQRDGEGAAEKGSAAPKKLPW